MVFRRKRRGVRGFRKRSFRRGYSRRKYGVRYSRFGRKGYSSVVRTYNAVEQTVAGESSWGMGFRLQDMPNYAEVTGMYSQYRITGVRVRFKPAFNSFSEKDNLEIPEIHYAWVYDTHPKVVSAAPAVSDMAQLKTYRRKLFNKTISTFARPFFGLAAEDSIGIEAAVAGRRSWLYTQFSDVPYGSLLVAVTDVAGSPLLGIKVGIEVTLYIQVRFLK